MAKVFIHHRLQLLLPAPHSTGADCHKASDPLTITSLYTHRPRDAL